MGTISRKDLSQENIGFFLAGFVEGEGSLEQGGNLADIAPTMLAILHLDQPAEMSGRSLLNL